MYLTSWEEQGYVRDKSDEISEAKVKTNWKGYSFDIINKLTDEKYLYYCKSKSVTITPEGEKLAKELIELFGN